MLDLGFFVVMFFFKIAKSNDEDQNVTASFLNNVPGKLDRFDIFVNNIRSKIGILILYHSRKVDHLEQFFNVIRSRDYLCDILVNL